MSRIESESFKKYKEEAKPKIIKIVEKESFLSLRSLQILLEKEDFWHTVTRNAVEDLRKEKIIRTAKYPTRGSYPKWVYKYDLRITDIKGQIDKDYKPLYEDFIKASSSMGKHCENIIEKAFTKLGYINLSRNEDTKYFRGRIYPKNKDIDIISYKNGVFYGIEVKNLISYPNWNEDIIKKKDVAEYHGIQFVLLNRELGSYGYDLFRCGGLHIEFNEIIWSSKFSSLAKRINKMLYFPIICMDEPSNELISKIRNVEIYHDRHFYGKGRY